MPWIANRDQRFAEEYSPGPNTVCISITEPNARARLRNGFADVLRLQFDDLEAQSTLWLSQLGRGVQLCTPQDARRIANFARKHRGKNFLVHCAAGISRSGAVTETLLEAFPEYQDRGGKAYGWPRWPNGLVCCLLREALHLPPKERRRRSPIVLFEWEGKVSPPSPLDKRP